MSLDNFAAQNPSLLRLVRHAGYNTLLRKVKSAGYEYDDVSQDIWCLVCRYYPTYDQSKGSVANWVVFIARNALINMLRKKRLTRVPLYDNDHPSPPNRETVELPSMHNLTPKQKYVITHLYLKGESRGEVAAALKCSKDSVDKVRLYTIRKLRGGLGR